MPKKTAIASARISIGHVSLTVRYAALAPVDAKKKITIRPETTCEARTEERGGDRRDHLGQEERAVLRVREVVPVRVGEDRARRRERDEHDSLRESGTVDDLRFGRRCHARAKRLLLRPLRCCSPPGVRAGGRRRGSRSPSRSAPGSPR